MSVFHQPTLTHVDHVHIYVKDLQLSKAYYQEVIGFKVLEEKGNSIKLTADGKTALLTIEQPEGIQPKLGRTTGLYHFAILVPTRKDLGLFLRHLLINRIRLQGGSDHGFSEAIYLGDPDGNGIEVYADKPQSQWEYEADGQIKGITAHMDIEGLMSLVGVEEWDGLPSETVMGHIHLHVDELDKVDRFYREGLGLELMTSFPRQAYFYSWGGYHHHIAVNIWNGVGALHPHPKSVGLTHYTVRFPSETDRQAVVERLQGLGYEVKIIDQDFMTQDPAGNKIVLAIQ